MTRRRWIADEYSRDRAALVGEHAAHLSRTLRARVGQQFEVACGDALRQGTITSVTDDCVEFALGEELPAGQTVPITLLLAVFKFDRMEWAIEKCTELNVTTIVPVVARRTEKHLAQAAASRAERWRRIAREASEQSRRLAPPDIAAPLKLSEAVANIRSVDAHITSSSLEENSRGTSHDFASPTDARSGVDAPERHGSREEFIQSASPVLTSSTEPRSGGCDGSPGRKPRVDAPSNRLSPVGRAQAGAEDFIPGRPALRIVLAENERTLMLTDILRSNQPHSFTLAIGPEGGWTPDELQLFTDAQFLSCSLGETILRAETAAIAALAIARAEL